jgi:hypothetical protein
MNLKVKEEEEKDIQELQYGLRLNLLIFNIILMILMIKKDVLSFLNLMILL